MDEAFVIMQIGDAELDALYENQIAPALESAGLTPRRVDRHNSGQLLKSEIVTFIDRAKVIVADVTNERPNCYLEIGYAMGQGKFENLILTAREDHHHSSESYSTAGPRIHFDLEGYDILLWEESDLVAFQSRLSETAERRKRIVTAPKFPAAAALDASIAGDAEPGFVHDVVLNLVSSGGGVALEELLRVERQRFRDGANGYFDELLASGRAPGAEAFRDVWDEFVPMLERRLAVLLPLALYDEKSFSGELSSLVDFLESQQPRAGYEIWTEVAGFGLAWVGYICGAIAVLLEKYQSVALLIGAWWIDRYGYDEQLVWLPNPFGAELSKASVDGNRLVPEWDFVTRSVAELKWLTERHPELVGGGEPLTSMAIFDVLVCIDRGIRDERSFSYASILRGGVGGFYRRAASRSALRSELARAVGLELDVFDAQAAVAFEKSNRPQQGFDSFSEIRNALRLYSVESAPADANSWNA